MTIGDLRNAGFGAWVKPTKQEVKSAGTPPHKITTNDLKKGDMVMQVNGWKARIEDNMRGNTRLATVYGLFTEMGSIYCHDIQCRLNPDGTFTSIAYTPAQLKLRKTVQQFGF